MSTADDSLALLQISDLHLLETADQKMLGVATEYYFLQILEKAFAKGQTYDLLLVTGDLAQHPSIEVYQRLRSYLDRLQIPAVCLPGNHDNFQLMQQVFSHGAVSCNKQTVFKHWQIICLNSQIIGSPGGYIAPSELAFLAHCLESYPEHFALVAMHHHCVPANSTWLDSMLIENAAEFLRLLQLYPQAKAVTLGHVHQALHRQVGHLSIFGNPSTCFQFTPLHESFSLDQTPPGFRQWFLAANGTFTHQIHRLSQPLQDLVWDEWGYAEDV